MFSRLSLPQLGTVLVKTAVVGQEEGGAGLAGVDCGLLVFQTLLLKIIIYSYSSTYYAWMQYKSFWKK